MSFKVSFYDAIKNKSRRVFITFTWDSANHRWDVSYRNDYAENPCIGHERRDPVTVVRNYADNLVRSGEYVNIKRIPA